MATRGATPDVRECFDPYGDSYRHVAAMLRILESHGFWAETCTCWYAALYPSVTTEEPC
jgi:hypothetical protein